jgi:hypothetical protein
MAVAVRLYPASKDRKWETDYHKADAFEAYDKHGSLSVIRDGKVVAIYPEGEYRSARMSTRKFRTPKVTFVRRFVRNKSDVAGV